MFFAVMPKLLTLFVAAATHVRADPNPNSPGPGDIFMQGKSCLISWDIDTTGIWTKMDIDLMTGNNFDMVFLASVAKGIDGTNPSKNTFSYTCPQVTPHSAVYFYQFSSPSTQNKTWTGRFAITDSPGNIVAPSQSTQPDGANITWGIGSVVNASVALSASAKANTTLMSSAPSASRGLSLLHTLTPSFVRVTSSAHLTPTGALKAGANGTPPMLSIVDTALHAILGLGIAALGFGMVL